MFTAHDKHSDDEGKRCLTVCRKFNVNVARRAVQRVETDFIVLKPHRVSQHHVYVSVSVTGDPQPRFLDGLPITCLHILPCLRRRVCHGTYSHPEEQIKSPIPSLHQSRVPDMRLCSVPLGRKCVRAKPFVPGLRIRRTIETEVEFLRMEPLCIPKRPPAALSMPLVGGFVTYTTNKKPPNHILHLTNLYVATRLPLPANKVLRLTLLCRTSSLTVSSRGRHEVRPIKTAETGVSMARCACEPRASSGGSGCSYHAAPVTVQI
jgi:hypothetical protein